MPRSQIEKEILARAGEYLVAAELSLRGYLVEYVANLRLRETLGIDLLVHNPRSGKKTGIQVMTREGAKSGSGGDEYLLPEEERINTPFVFVWLEGGKNPEYYIVPPQDLIRLSRQNLEEYIRKSPGVDPKKQPRVVRASSLREYRDRWDLLGLD